MAERSVICPDCKHRFKVDAGPGDAVTCTQCDAEFEVAARTPAGARPSATGRKSAGGRRPTQAEPKGKNTAMIAAIVLGVLVLGGGAFFLMNGKGKEDPKANEKSEPSKPLNSDPTADAFDVAGGGAAGSSSTQEPQKEATPQRVVGREPKTLKMDDLLEDQDKLFVDKETRVAIQSLKTKSDEYLANRWDVSKEMQAEFKRIYNKLLVDRNNSFLRPADDELNKYNDLLKNELRKKAKNGEFLPKAFVGFPMEPYLFLIQADVDGKEEAIANDIHDQLKQLREAFNKEFSSFIELKEDPKKYMIKVMVLRTFDDYQAYNRARAPERDDNLVLAHYEPSARMLVVPLTFGGGDSILGDPDYERKAVMFHEGTHQLVDAYAKSSHLSAFGPMWADEGLAEHFGGFTVGEDGKYVFRKLNRMRCFAIGQLGKNPDRRMKLEDVLKWSRSIQAEEEGKNLPFAQARTLQVYAQGWAMIDFLASYKNGKYRDKYEAMMKRLFKDGDTGLRLFQQFFKTEDEFEAVRKEFNEYLDTLATAWNEGRIYDGEIHDTPKKK